MSSSSPGDDISPRPDMPDFKELEQTYTKEQRKNMLRHETNIWACIYRMSKTELPIQFDQLDLDLNFFAQRELPT